MSQSRQFWNAVALVVISIASVLGGILLSLSENVSSRTEFLPTSTNIENAVIVPTLVTITPTSPAPIITSTSSNTPTSTSSPLPAASCPPPPTNWFPIVTHTGDTLEVIAIIYKTTPEQLRAINCLLVDSLVPNTTLYVPPLVVTPVTSTVGSCSPPSGWVKTYVVQRGDTLFSISQSFGVTLSSVKNANCIGNDYLIVTGQLLWVPNIPTRTPTAGYIPSTVTTIYLTDPLTATFLPYTATVLPTSTSLPLTSTPLPTLTASPTAIP